MTGTAVCHDRDSGLLGQGQRSVRTVTAVCQDCDSGLSGLRGVCQ